jgi:hypothetical protein
MIKPEYNSSFYVGSGDPVPVCKKIGSGMKILLDPNKHPGSATLR